MAFSSNDEMMREAEESILRRIRKRDGREEHPAHDDVVYHVSHRLALPCRRSAAIKEIGRLTPSEPPLSACVLCVIVMRADNIIEPNNR